MTGHGQLELFFLDGAAGRILGVYYPAQTGRERSSAVLYVPPFAEEMNRCRRMAALQARELARRGVGMLVLDLYGTGDSEGEIRDAAWDIWVADIAAGLEWLRHRGIEQVRLLGPRLGALLALEARGAWPGPIDELLLWQPLLRGRQALDQLMRARLVRSLGLLPERRETAEALRRQLAQGATLELAGYELNPALAAAIDKLDIKDLAPTPGTRVHWLEVQNGARLAPGSAAVFEGWRAAGVEVQARGVEGPPFWALQDITVAPALIEATSAALTT